MTYQQLITAAAEAAADQDYQTARAHYAKALEMRPNSAPLLYNHAQVCLKLGDRSAARVSLERFLELDQSAPDAALSYAGLCLKTGVPVRRELVGNAMSRSIRQRLPRPLRALLAADDAPPAAETVFGVPLDRMGPRQAATIRRARGLITRGRLSDAEALVDGLKETEATRVAILQLRGKLQLMVTQAAKAALLFEEALQSAPDEPTLHSDLLNAWMMAGRIGTAEAALAALPPALRQSDPVRMVEAELLGATGRPEEALAALEGLAQVPSLAARSLELRAQLLSTLGRFDDAQAALRHLADLRPNTSTPFPLAATIRRLEPGSDLFARAEAVADDPRIEQQQRAAAAFAVAKALRAAGDHDTSFARIVQGNALVDRMYDSLAEEQYFDSIKSAFTPDLLGRARDTSRGRGLVFVVGLPRSGSTLVSTILGRHPDAVQVGEFQGIWHCMEKATEAGYPERTAEFTDAFLADLAEAYLQELPSFAKQAGWVIDKELTKFVHLGLMRLIFPGARFVHTRRDPMDVCFSIYSQLFHGAFPYACRQETLAHFHHLHDDIMAHWYEVMGESLHECRYERLVAEPETEIPRLLQAAGMPFHEACMTGEESGRVVHTASVYQARQPIYKSSVGSWRRHADKLETLATLLGER